MVEMAQFYPCGPNGPAGCAGAAGAPLTPSQRQSLAEDGYRAGQRWARTPAARPHLEGLGEHWSAVGDGWAAPFEGDVGGEFTCGALQFHGLTHAGPGPRGAAEAFWRAALRPGDRGKEAWGAFVAGFAEGALAVWLSLEDEEAAPAEGGQGEPAG
jgi:hypothetical protein